MDDLKIYNIDKVIQDAAAAVTVDPETGEIVGQAELEALLQQGQDKVLNTARYLTSRATALEAMKEHMKAMRARIQAEEKRQAFFKECILRALMTLDKTALSDADIEVKMRKMPPSVKIEDESLIPAEFRKQKVEESFDLVGIKNAMKGGTTVPGAMLFSNWGIQIK